MSGEKDSVGRYGGEPTRTPPIDRTESPQPRMVSRVLKSELPLYQGVAEGLTQAELGTYSFAVAEGQINPVTKKREPEDSPYVTVTYSGPASGDKIWGMIRAARFAKQKAEGEGRPQTEIDQAVQNTIKLHIDSERRYKERLRALMERIDDLPKKSGQ